MELVHPLGISVEAEIGHVGSGESYDFEKGLTAPEEALRFIEDTGIDACAVAIGTAHGAYKGTPKLDFERLEAIKKATWFPLVLHGSSGTGEELIGRACRMGINKVNVANDLLKTAYTTVKATELEGNQVYDFWSIIADSLREFVKHQIEMTGSAGKSWNKQSTGLPRGTVTLKE